jgi:lysophospholipase L1-like esterase
MPETEITWHAVTGEMVEGKGLRDMLAPFDRLPGRAQAIVPGPVWDLSRHSAGLCYRFVSDAPTLRVRWSLTSANLAMAHMPATGVSGVDLYVRRRGDGVWRFAGVGQPRVQKDNVAELPAHAPGEAPAGDGRERREYRLYLPLYNGTAGLEIGVPVGHTIEAAPPYAENRRSPVVFYGTSITQGGCASRPGLAFPALVGRHLNVPTVNLGFSGNGRMEIALADLLCELDTPPSVLVLDCLRNMSEAQVAERVEPFVRRLRTRYVSTPILLAEDAFLENPESTPRGRLVRASVEKLTREGVPGLHFLPMRYGLGADGEGTVDLVHPNDIGMARLADAFAAGLMPLLPGR